MNRILILTMAAASVLAVSCNKEQKFEYTTEPEAITISNDMRTNPNDPTLNAFVFKQGEPIKIGAKFTINDKSLTPDQIGYEWYLGDKVVSTEDTLKLESKAVNRYTGILVLTDKRYDQKYMQEYNFQVAADFTNGWAIITEDGTKSHLDYLTIDANDGSYKYSKDVYVPAEGGAELPLGIKDLTHHMYDVFPQLFAINIVKQDEEGPIELDVHDMTVIGKIKNEFTSDKPDLKAKTVSYVYGSVYVQDESGDVYARSEAEYNGNVVPHAGKFPSNPISVGAPMQITHIVNTSGISSMITSYSDVFAFDAAGSKMVLFKNRKVIPFSDEFYTNAEEPNRGGAGSDGTKKYPDITFPDPGNLADYEMISMNAGGYNTGTWDTPCISIISILKGKKDGKYYFYTFRFWDVGTSIDVDLDLFFPLPDNVRIDPETMITRNSLGGADNIFYFTTKGNNSIYYLDAIDGSLGKVFETTSPVTAMGPGETQNMYGGMGLGDYTAYYPLYLIATEDGTLNVVKMDAFARAAGKADVVQTLKPGHGKIVKVCYLPDSSISY